jgi:hypothetical protein
MELYNFRKAHTENSSFGIFMYELGIPSGVIIEDEPRAVKVVNETRIKAKRYKLSILKELTPLTVKHRNSDTYKAWTKIKFKYHIMLNDVDNFTSIYFHILNTERDTSGCQGGGDTLKIVNGEYTAKNSSKFTEEFYSRIYPLLEAGKDVYYTIFDE